MKMLNKCVSPTKRLVDVKGGQKENGENGKRHGEGRHCRDHGHKWELRAYGVSVVRET